MIDLVQLRKEIKDGVFEIYQKRNKIYIKDAQTEECIMICDLENVNKK